MRRSSAKRYSDRRMFHRIRTKYREIERYWSEEILAGRATVNTRAMNNLFPKDKESEVDDRG